MEDIVLKLTISHYKCELAPNFIESQPRLEIYFDDNIKCSPVEVMLDANDEYDQIYDVEINGKFSTRKKLPTNTKLAFTSFCSTFNENNAPCMVDAGTSYINLIDIINNPHPTYNKDIHLLLHTSDNYEKGKFNISIEKKGGLHLGGIQIDKSMKIGDSVNMEKDEAMNDYIKLNMSIENTMTDTIVGTDRIRVPIYYGQVGMESTRCPLPAIGYCMYQTPESSQEFWSNALDTVLARENKTRSNFRSMSIKGKARVWAQMMVLQTQYLDYIGDKADKNSRNKKTQYKVSLRVGCEDFGDALFTLSGDCEDLANAIMQTCASFRKAKIKREDELDILQKIGLQYINIMSLDAVTAAAVGDRLDPANIGAHMNVNFLPAYYVKECLKRAKKQFVSIEVPFREEEEWSRELPVLIGEGTGMFETLGFEDGIDQERALVYSRCKSLKAFKKPIVHEEGAPSRFFVGSVLGFTDYWLEKGVPLGGFWYTTPKLGTKDKLSRGVKFVDIERKTKNVGLVLHPQVPDLVMERIKEATSLRIKARPLFLTNQMKMKHPEKNKFLDNLVSLSDDHAELVDDPVPVYVRDYQLNQNLMKKLYDEISRLPENVSLAITYKKESITNQVFGYKVDFHIN